MSQQQFVELPSGHIYEFDTFSSQYVCTHALIKRETVEVDYMREGEHDTYKREIAICDNPECGEELEDYNMEV